MHIFDLDFHPTAVTMVQSPVTGNFRLYDTFGNVVDVTDAAGAEALLAHEDECGRRLTACSAWA